MFWKHADFHKPGRLRSIGTRLTLFYTLAALAAVIVFTALLYWKLANNFNAEHLHFLQDKTHELMEDFHDGGDRPAMLLSEIAKETAGTDLRQYEGRVLGMHDELLGETPGMTEQLPHTLFPAPVRVDNLSPTAIRNQYLHGQHYVLASLTLDASGRYTLQLALNVTRDDLLLADYQRGLAIFLLLLIPVLLVAGHFVTAHGLRPLRKIVQAAKVITSANLAYRIPMDPPWPPELEDLVRVFNDMLQRLDAAFTRLARFSADIAHELRNPVNNLMGEMEVCLTRERRSGEYRATLESGLEECRRLAGLIENLLFIARAENAETILYAQWFDVREVCTRLLELQTHAAGARGVRFAYEGDAQLYADPLLFRQALDNLLANAIRYSPAGTEVRVKVRGPAADYLEIEVSDQGEGIPTEHLPHVFERFYQADPSRARQGQGTGLGLAIVRSIMELHGGEVSVHSEYGAGTLVRLRFPAVPAR